MTQTDFLALAPLIVLTLTLGLVMFQIAIRRHHGAVMGLTVLGLAVALCVLPAAGKAAAEKVTALLVLDSQALFFIGLILAGTAATALLAYGYLERLGERCEEFYLLLLMAALGAVVLAMSRHFASFFIGLEILSVSLYAMVAYPRRRATSLEAGLKYLILAAVSAAFLLFGMALIYTVTGSLDFARLQSLSPSLSGPGEYRFLLAGTALLVVGIGFKLALVPFHMWAPDVYQGAPAPVAGFVATVSKAALVVLLVRLFAPVDLRGSPPLFWIFAFIAVASMVGGNLLALLQNRVKRILAYSSIAHMGYLLVAFMAGGRGGVQTAAFYMAAYTITTLGAFAVVSVLSPKEGDADLLTDFQGLAYRCPWLGGIFTIMLLSLAGIPLTVGFMGKFYIVTTGLRGALEGLVITLLVTSGVSLYYYLRIVVVLFSRQEEEGPGSSPALAQIGLSDGLVLATMTILLVWLGIGPGPLLYLIHGIGG